MSETNEALGRDIVAAAVLRGSFRLRSGAQSSYYIDKYLFTTRPDLLRRIADELSLRLPAGAQRIAGPVLGAIPLLTALSLVTELPMLIVRVDQPKEYGTSNRLEGAYEEGERVCLVEDVVTSGGALLDAVAALREAGLTVRTAICIVDREEGGAAALARETVQLRPIFRARDVGNATKSAAKPHG